MRKERVRCKTPQSQCCSSSCHKSILRDQRISVGGKFLHFIQTQNMTDCKYAQREVQHEERKHFQTIQSVTFVKIFTQMNIWIYLCQQIYTNEYPNTFLHKILHERMSEEIFVLKFVWIFEYILRLVFAHSRTDVWIYSYKQMSEYICKQKIGPNECPNKYLWPIYLNIWIFEYIRRTLKQSLLKGIKGWRVSLEGCHLEEIYGSYGYCL